VTELPSIVVQAADAFGLDRAGLRSLGGNAGSSWDAGTAVLRVGFAAVLDVELAAAGAAAAVLPVPTVIDRADFADRSALLLERLPGRPAGELAVTSPARARAAGLACGRVHDALAGVPAPAGLRAVPGAPTSVTPSPATPSPARLLHLDLHPLNVLVDDDGAVTGVLDWANTAAGDPVLDRARTWAILSLDPAARAAQTWPGWPAFTEGWYEAGRLDDLPAGARAWACRFMLADLASRYSPAELAHVRGTLDQLG
jgi:Ser/Thr protein kinase RdoA (MazF antagonist)